METQVVADFLMQKAYSADSLHGDLTQAQKDTVMKKYRLKNIDILVTVSYTHLDVYKRQRQTFLQLNFLQKKPHLVVLLGTLLYFR